MVAILRRNRHRNGPMPTSIRTICLERRFIQIEMLLFMTLNKCSNKNITFPSDKIKATTKTSILCFSLVFLLVFVNLAVIYQTSVSIKLRVINSLLKKAKMFLLRKVEWIRKLIGIYVHSNSSCNRIGSCRLGFVRMCF